METETKPTIRPLEQLVQLNPVTLIHLGEIDAGNISQLHRIASTTYGILKALEIEPNTQRVIYTYMGLLDVVLQHLTEGYLQYASSISNEITQNDLIAYRRYLLKYFSEFKDPNGDIKNKYVHYCLNSLRDLFAKRVLKYNPDTLDLVKTFNPVYDPNL